MFSILRIYVTQCGWFLTFNKSLCILIPWKINSTKNSNLLWQAGFWQWLPENLELGFTVHFIIILSKKLIYFRVITLFYTNCFFFDWRTLVTFKNDVTALLLLLILLIPKFILFHTVQTFAETSAKSFFLQSYSLF